MIDNEIEKKTKIESTFPPTIRDIEGCGPAVVQGWIDEFKKQHNAIYVISRSWNFITQKDDPIVDESALIDFSPTWRGALVCLRHYLETYDQMNLAALFELAVIYPDGSEGLILKQATETMMKSQIGW